MKGSFGKPTGAAITSFNIDLRGSKLCKWYRHITVEDWTKYHQVKADGQHSLKAIFTFFFFLLLRHTSLLPLH